MKPSASRIHSYLNKALPGFEPVAPPAEIDGGNLNHVWRVRGKNGSVIVKYAPPYIAANPGVPIDPGRLAFEAGALKLLSDGGDLLSVRNDCVRPPELLAFDNEQSILVMEDIFPSVEWFVRISEGKKDPGLAKHLGRFIGTLHAHTFQRQEIADRFRNLPIQKTRQEIQYDSVAETLTDHGIDSTGAVKNAKELGNSLLKPGICLVMGDLWPPSILYKDGKLRLIDWEFAHFGRPLQDVAHFAAHCFMYHKRFSGEPGRNFKTVWQNFLSGYREGSGNRFDALVSREETEAMNIHFGAEILIRTIGAFQEEYIFSNQQDNIAEELITTAVDRMCNPGRFAKHPGVDLLF